MDTKTIHRLLKSCTVTRKHYRGVYPADKISKCIHFPCSIVANLVGENSFNKQKNLGHFKRKGISLGGDFCEKQKHSILF